MQRSSNKRTPKKRYGQTFLAEDAEFLGIMFDMMARGGDLSVLRKSPQFAKLYAQIVRLRKRAREDAEINEAQVRLAANGVAT